MPQTKSLAGVAAKISPFLLARSPGASTPAIGLYPNLLISTTDPAYNLTAVNAASADNTLQVALIVAVLGMPFVLLYTAGVYWIFRGKATVGSDGY